MENKLKPLYNILQQQKKGGGESSFTWKSDFLSDWDLLASITSENLTEGLPKESKENLCRVCDCKIQDIYNTANLKVREKLDS